MGRVEAGKGPFLGGVAGGPGHQIFLLAFFPKGWIPIGWNGTCFEASVWLL